MSTSANSASSSLEKHPKGQDLSSSSSSSSTSSIQTISLTPFQNVKILYKITGTWSLPEILLSANLYRKININYQQPPFMKMKEQEEIKKSTSAKTKGDITTETEEDLIQSMSEAIISKQDQDGGDSSFKSIKEKAVQDYFVKGLEDWIELEFGDGIEFKDQSTSTGQPVTSPRPDIVFYSKEYMDEIRKKESKAESKHAVMVLELKKPSDPLGKENSQWIAQIVQRGRDMLSAAPWRGSVILAVSNGINMRFVNVSLCKQPIDNNTPYSISYFMSGSYTLATSKTIISLLQYIRMQFQYCQFFQERINIQEEYEMLGIGASGACSKATLKESNVECCIKTFNKTEECQAESLILDTLNTIKHLITGKHLPNEEFNFLNRAIATTPIGISLDKLNKMKVRSGDIFVPLIRTLKVVHERAKLAHRDIKPENIIYVDNNTLCLIDWGFATTIEDKKEKPYCGSVMFVSERILKQMIKNENNWSIGVVYTAIDDLVGLLKTIMYMICPGVSDKIDSYSKEGKPFPQEVFNLWDEIWKDEEGAKFLPILNELNSGKGDLYDYLEQQIQIKRLSCIDVSTT